MDEYAIKPNGKDDTDAIQRALDDKHLALLLPWEYVGRYRVSRPLQLASGSIRGLGGEADIEWIGPETDGAMLTSAQKTWTPQRLHDLILHCEGRCRAIDVTKPASGSTYERVTVHEALPGAVRMSQLYSGDVRQLRLFRCPGTNLSAIDSNDTSLQFTIGQPRPTGWDDGAIRTHAVITGHAVRLHPRVEGDFSHPTVDAVCIGRPTGWAPRQVIVHGGYWELTNPHRSDLRLIRCDGVDIVTPRFNPSGANGVLAENSRSIRLRLPYRAGYSMDKLLKQVNCKYVHLEL